MWTTLMLLLSILLDVLLACTCSIILLHWEPFFGITGCLFPFHPSSNTHLYLVLVGLSRQPHCFVLKVHFYFAFKWIEMQISAVLWVGGETDTGVYCPLRGQGARLSCVREDGVVPTPPLSLFTWNSTEHCFSLHSKRQGAPWKREAWKNHDFSASKVTTEQNRFTAGPFSRKNRWMLISHDFFQPMEISMIKSYSTSLNLS